MHDIPASATQAVDGLTTISSAFGPKETLDRLANEILAQRLQVFARVDHAAGAAEIGLTLRPTELVIFGNARGGTPLMQAVQTTGIDLPLKALIWEDDAGKTWISYNEPNWIARRHGLPHLEVAVNAIAAAITMLMRKVAGVEALSRTAI